MIYPLSALELRSLANCNAQPEEVNSLRSDSTSFVAVSLTLAIRSVRLVFYCFVVRICTASVLLKATIASVRDSAQPNTDLRPQGVVNICVVSFSLLVLISFSLARN
jgi:hypothetical protein